MPTIAADQTASLTLTDNDSVTISTLGVAIVSNSSGKIAEVAGTRTLGPFAAGSLTIFASGRDCSYEVADGPDGKVIAIGGGEQPSENTPAARAVKTIAAVTQTQLITSNSSAATGQRLACAEKNRKRIVFKNPASNTVSIQIGQTQNDNINRNGSYTTSYTIAPGEELVCWYDQNQWYARQASATAVANQSLIVESEVNV